jgi:glucose-1-phosphate thymidylyltransferase
LTEILPCVGLIPAAGLATRLGALPCSKEILPLPQPGSDKTNRIRVVADCLLDAYKSAGIEDVYFIIRKGKWDIPAFYGDGYPLGLNITYLMMRHPFGTPFTLDQAFPFIKDKRIALGFPDIQFSPGNVYQQLLSKQTKTNADVVLGLFPPDNPSKFDMVDFSPSGQVKRIDIKPIKTNLEYGWICAVWTPTFSSFMHEFLAKALAENELENAPEIYVGTVMQAALREGMTITTEIFPAGEAIDVGTTDALATVMRLNTDAHSEN